MRGVTVAVERGRLDWYDLSSGLRERVGERRRLSSSENRFRCALSDLRVEASLLCLVLGLNGS